MENFSPAVFVVFSGIFAVRLRSIAYGADGVA